MFNRFNNLLRRIGEINKKPVMNLLPGQLAFFFVLSIPPLISIVGMVCSNLSISTQSFIKMINESFPASTSSLIMPIISGQGLGISMLIFILGSLYMVSNGTHAIITASNAIYNVNSNGFVRRRIKALFLVIMIVILLAFIIIVPVFGDLIMTIIREGHYFDNIINQLSYVYNLIKLPISFFFVFFIIKLIYTISPDEEIKSKDVTYGAIFTTTLWIIATKLYSYYITHFAAYDLFYGNIASLIILLLWIYLLSYIFVLGLALNAGAYSSDPNHKK